MSGAVPQLRFPGFVGEWERRSIGDWFKVSAGGDVPPDCSKTWAPTSPYPIYSNSEKGSGLYGYWHSYREEGGAVTVTGRGALGIPVARRSAFTPIVRLLVLRPKEPADVFFFESALKTIDFFVESTGVPQLTGPQVSGYEVSAPTLAEQQKIADFLGTVDAKIDALRRKKSGLEAFKSGLMQRLFSQTLRFTRDDGTDFPDWEEGSLGELGTFSKGKGISKADISEDGALPCIRYGEIYTQYGERITEIISRTDVSPSTLTLSQMNDVIIPASGETPIDMALACCVLVPGVALGGDINIFRSPVNGEYLAYLLTNARRTEIAQMAQGNSVVHLYPAQLRQIVIPVPHPDEQRKIADALSALDAKITAVADQITHMEVFKKGLLQRMFI